MLLVQNYLKNNTFADLEKTHGVYASFSKCGKFFSLNYDQIEAKESDPLSQECRGLILSLSSYEEIPFTMENSKKNRSNICPGDTVILSYPMKRFFNAGQESAAEINWNDNNLAVLEKLDGTLCHVWYNPIYKQWSVATRSVPEANIPINNSPLTFRLLFEQALLDTINVKFDDFTKNLNTRYTYCFELTSPLNRVVVKYDNYRVTLLSIRDLDSLQEIDIFNNPIGVPVVRKFNFDSLSETLDWVSTLNPLEYEGVVVLDSKFNRIKVKNAAYVAYNKSLDKLGSSDRNCLEIILLEKDDDVMQFLPETITENMIKIKKSLQNFILIHDSFFQKCFNNCSNDRKTFALLVKSNKQIWSPAMFGMFGKNINMKEFINSNKTNGAWNDSFLNAILNILKYY